LSKKFIGTQGVNQMLVTLSEHGMILVNDSDSHHVQALKRKILDVSGAGDTVISAAALALAAGCDEQVVATLANLAGGIVCEKVGVVPIEKNLLIREYNSLY